MSYENGGLTSLGVQCGESFWTHSEMEDHLNKVGYQQPLFWNTPKSKMAMDRLKAVERISTDKKYTEENFLKEFKPENKVSPKFTGVDHEGFVLLVKTNCTKRWDYSKLKTELYYKFHKPREEYMPYLIEYSLTHEASHFPAAKIIADSHRAFFKVNISSLERFLTKCFGKFPIDEPTEEETINDPKLIGKYNAYQNKRSAMETTPTERTISAFRKFLSNNQRGTGLQFEAYKVILEAFGVGYIGEFYDEIKTKTKKSNVDTRMNKLMDESIKLVSQCVNDTLTPENVVKLSKHMLFLRLNIPQK